MRSQHYTSLRVIDTRQDGNARQKTAKQLADKNEELHASTLTTIRVLIQERPTIITLPRPHPPPSPRPRPRPGPIYPPPDVPTPPSTLRRPAHAVQGIDLLGKNLHQKYHDYHANGRTTRQRLIITTLPTPAPPPSPRPHPRPGPRAPNPPPGVPTPPPTP